MNYDAQKLKEKAQQQIQSLLQISETWQHFVLLHHPD